MSTVVMPWSVKGVSDEARALAKVKAAEAGQNIGAWLNEIILNNTVGSTKEYNPVFNGLKLHDFSGNYVDDTVAPESAVVETHKAESDDENPSVLETVLANQAKTKKANEDTLHLVLAMAQRLATLEKDTVGFAASFQDQLSDLRARVQRLEQSDTALINAQIRRSQPA
jgi:hypothetical protein